MAFIGSLLGAGKGSDFQASGSVNPVLNQSPVDQGQINSGYAGAQNSMQSQNALLSALQSQGGLSNQAQGYSQLQGIANGTGPNPAQAQYQQNIQSLAGQQAGAISSQKGLSPALQARLIAQQGSGAMQNAAGQGAANLATQQLGAMNAAAGIANTQVTNQIGQTNANTASQLGEQQNLLNAQGQYNNAQAGVLSNMNTTNSATQIQNSKAQAGLLGGAFSFLAGGGEVGYDGGGSVMPAPQMPSAFSQAPPQGPQSAFGKFLAGYSAAQQQPGQQGQPGAPGNSAEAPFQSNQFNSLGNVGRKIFGLKPDEHLLRGGPNGGAVQPSQAAVQSGSSIDEANMPVDAGSGTAMGEDGASEAGAAEGAEGAEGASAAEGAAAAEGEDEGIGELVAALAKGGKVKGKKKVDALVSPGELWIPPGKVGQVAKGENPLKAGKKIPGKPKVSGNSYVNDTVPKKLDVGGIVIPNSIMESKNPAKGARDMVAGIIAKRRARG